MKKQLLPLVATLLLLPTACSTDNAYDNLMEDDGIDMTMKIATGLTLPFGSTSPIYLTEMMDSSKVAQLTIDADGRFFISENGEFSETSVKVNDVNLAVHPVINPRVFNLSVEQESLPEEIRALLSTLNVGDDLSAFSQVVVNIGQDEIDFTDEGAFTLHKDNVDPALISIEKVKLKEVSVVSIDIKIDNLPKQNKDVEAVGFSMDVPKFLELQDEQTPGIYNITDKVWKDTELTSVEWTENFYVTGLDFTRDEMGAITVENGTLECGGELNCHGVVRLVNVRVTGEDLIIALNEDGKKVVELKNPVVINVNPSLDIPDMPLGEVQGRFAPKINPISTSFGIDMGSDMDFLTNDEAVIDLENPEILLTINNNCPVKIVADIQVTADNGNEVRFEAIDLTAVDGAAHVTLNSDNVAEGYNLHTFLSPLPKSVKVSVEPRVLADESSVITLGDSYTVNGGFDISVPLAFRHINFSYDQTMSDVWGGGRDEITSKVASIEGIVLKMKVGNTIPLDMKVIVSGTNYATGKEDPSVISCSFDSIIKAGSLENEVDTDVNVTLDIPDTSKLGSLIVRFEGAGDNYEFNAKQYVRIKEANVTFSKGVNVNMN